MRRKLIALKKMYMTATLNVNDLASGAPQVWNSLTFEDFHFDIIIAVSYAKFQKKLNG